MTSAQAPTGNEIRSGNDDDDIPRRRGRRRQRRTLRRKMRTRNVWHLPPWRATRTTTSLTDVTAPPSSESRSGGDDNDIPRRRWRWRRRRTRWRMTVTGNAWHRLPGRTTRMTTSLNKATMRATVAALTTTTMSLSAHDGNGEHTTSLGGGRDATVPEGRLCGCTRAE